MYVPPVPKLQMGQLKETPRASQSRREASDPVSVWDSGKGKLTRYLPQSEPSACLGREKASTGLPESFLAFTHMKDVQNFLNTLEKENLTLCVRTW